MSTYVYMRILESAPLRDDRGIRLLSLGRVSHMYEAVAQATVCTETTPSVLEIGCGTGNLTQALIARDARRCSAETCPRRRSSQAVRNGRH